MTRDLDTEGPASGQQRIDVGRPKILDLFCGAGWRGGWLPPGRLRRDWR